VNYQLEGLRILIIDDNAHIRQLLRTILYAVGIRAIDVSEDGVTGFDAFCRLEYDLVFTDHEMEPISGLDLVDMIRTSLKSPNRYVPVIIISSYSDEERVQDACDRGVTEFLAKPFTVDVLMPRLESVIEEPRPFVRTDSYFARIGGGSRINTTRGRSAGPRSSNRSRCPFVTFPSSSAMRSKKAAPTP
jgi:two-component system chemotaxis response regulator CheY